MDNHLMTLLAGLAVLLISGIIFWPGKGLTAKWKRSKMDAKRVLVEDSLKLLYDLEFRNKPCYIQTLAENLNISIDQTEDLFARLSELGLVEKDNQKVLLSSEGRTYALRIIRIHRLWERYLADHTSVIETEWHNQAEEKEHTISSSEADELAAKLGNPVFDPHGDPIPGADGKFPRMNGKPLVNIPSGKLGRIIHLEDEPKEIYAQLAASGLYPGMQIRMIENNMNRVRFEADGEICTLAPVIASNVTVVALEEAEEVKEKFETLSTLKINESAVVVGISPLCRGQQRRRLLDFGFVPGTEIRAQLQSLKGDPTAYEIRGGTIALRKNQSDLIQIRKL